MRLLVLISGHLTSCPRAIKFADALSAAGHEVRVHSVPVLDSVLPLDESLAARKVWQHAACVKRPHLAARALCRLAPLLAKVPPLQRAAAFWRQGFAFQALLASASRSTARDCDGVFAFNLPALAAAVVLKQRFGWRFHFDAEDDHVSLLPDAPEFASERSLRERISRIGFAEAHTLSTAAPLMAESLRSRYGRAVPVILNTFDSEARASTRQAQPSAIRFCWHSQMIGPDRGLEQAIQIIAGIEGASLHIRGMKDPDFLSMLSNLAHEHGLSGERFRVLDLVAPPDLIGSLAAFDVGLATEIASTENRDRCLANKIFEYLAAGLPMILSSTRAHAEIAREFGAAALLIDLHDIAGSRQAILRWCASAEQMQNARAQARQLALARYNWQTEATRLLQHVDQHWRS